MYVTFGTSLVHLGLSLIFTKYSLYYTCLIYVLIQFLIFILIRRIAVKTVELNNIQLWFTKKNFFKNLWSKSSIIASLKLEGKYLERFYELLECEYLVKNTPGYVNSRYENINSSFLKLLIVTLGAFLSILQWPFYNHKVRYKTTRFNKLVLFLLLVI